MSDFPIQAILFPILAIGVVLFFLKRKKMMIADGEQMYAKFRLGDISQRMQLSIVQGDPTFNLMMAYATHNQKDFASSGGVLGALSGEGTKESRVLLRGAPNGRPTEFSYYYRSDIDQGFTGRTLTETFECRLSVQVAYPFPPFEVVLRSPAAGMESPAEMVLPACAFGDPTLDAKFLLRSADPRIGPAIAAALAPLLSIGFLHIRASDQQIGFFATLTGSSMALYSIEQVQYALDRMSLVFEGRAPAMAS